MTNNPKSKICIAFLTLGAAIYAPQALAFGLGDLLGGSKTSSASAVDPDTFIKSALAAEQLMNSSVDLLAGSLVSKTKLAEIEAKKKSANAETDPKEKEAKLSEVKKSEVAAVNEALNDEKAKSDIENMDSQKKQQLGAAAFNFMLALIQDKDLIGQTSGLIRSLSGNPMNIVKLGNIKDVASSLSNQISSASQIATKMPTIFSAVGVEAPTNKDDKSKVQVATTNE